MPLLLSLLPCAWALPETVLTVVSVDPTPLQMDVSLTVDGGRATLNLLNVAGGNLSVDWQQSTLVLPGGRSVGLVPGWIIRSHGDAVLPPSVAAAGGRVVEVLFRRDELGLGDEREAMMTSSELGLSILDLVVSREGAGPVHWRATVSASVNPAIEAERLAELARQEDVRRQMIEAQAEALRLAAAERRQACLTTKAKYDKRAHLWGGLGAVGLGGGGAITAVSGIYELVEIGHPVKQDNAAGALGLGIIGLAFGVTAELISWKQHHNGVALHCEDM